MNKYVKVLFVNYIKLLTYWENIMARCTLCGKKAVSGSNVSHSQVHTKRKFKPNLQKVNGLVMCTKCLKTIKTISRREIAE